MPLGDPEFARPDRRRRLWGESSHDPPRPRARSGEQDPGSGLPVDNAAGRDMKREQLVVDEPTPHLDSGGSAPAPGPRPAWYAILVAGALPPGSGTGLDGFRAT